MTSCKECRYWVETDYGVGECRKNAPVPTGMGKFTPHWPETKENEYCGEGQAPA